MQFHFSPLTMSGPTSLRLHRRLGPFPESVDHARLPIPGIPERRGPATGIIDAENVKVARLKLRKEGVYPTDVVEQGQTSGRTPATTRAKPSRVIGRTSVLTANDLSLLTRQFATLLVAGLPLVDALGVLVDQAEKKPIKSLLADIREQVRGEKR